MSSEYRVLKRDKRWHWILWLDHHGPIAYCRKDGYASKNAAMRSILSAKTAARGADHARIQYWGERQ